MRQTKTKTTEDAVVVEPKGSDYAGPTSIYLDRDSREKLDDLSENTGQSKSQVMRALIQGADGERDKRLAELAAEIADLLVVR